MADNTDEQPPISYAEITQELISGIKKIFDARNQHRTGLLSERVDPALTMINQIHDDFIMITVDLTDLLTTMRNVLKSRANNRPEQLKPLVDSLRKLNTLRNENRSKRRLFFEEIGAYMDDLKLNRSTKRITLNETEIANLVDLYQTIRNYLQRESGIYAHELGHHLDYVSVLLDRSINRENVTDSSLVENVERMIPILKKYEVEREQRWSEIAKEYGKVKVDLQSEF